MSTLYRGEVAGIVCVFALIGGLAAQYLFGGISESIPSATVALVLYLIICGAYLLLLLAVQEVVKSVGDATFMRRMRDFLVATIIGCFLMAPLVAPVLVPGLIVQILGLVSIVIVAILGIVSIRIAPFFGRLEGERAPNGKKAATWLKVSGWLMATVILSFIGVFASLAADFYMWRLVRQERLKSTS